MMQASNTCDICGGHGNCHWCGARREKPPSPFPASTYSRWGFQACEFMLESNGKITMRNIGFITKNDDLDKITLSKLRNENERIFIHSSDFKFRDLLPNCVEIVASEVRYLDKKLRRICFYLPDKEMLEKDV